MKRLVSVTFIVVLLLAAAQPAWARLGVGVNVGNIEVNEPLLSGGIYDIATMSVINTGNETSDYGVGVSYRDKQKEMKPPEEWFRFSPARFELKPGRQEPVDISLTIPVNAKAGDYFALIGGHPIADEQGLNIGIAAAAKINFTVKSSSLFWSIVNRLTTWFANNSPYSYIVAGVILLAIAILIIRRYLKLSFKIERKGK